MIKIADCQQEYYDFHLYKGCAFGNLGGNLFVYFGERSTKEIKLWTRAKSAAHGSTVWHKISIDNTYKYWYAFDILDIKVDYTLTRSKRERIEKQTEHKVLKKELAYVDTLASDYRYISRSMIKTPSSKGELYATDGVQYRKSYELKGSNKPIVSKVTRENNL